MTMRRNDIWNLMRQIDAVREFSNSMLGDMSVDRGGPEDVAYRVLSECFDDPIERHAELVAQVGCGSPVAERTLRRLSLDYPTRSRAFMEMRNLVNRGLRSLTDNIASDPARAARHILEMERMLAEPAAVRRTPEPPDEPVLTRAYSAPVNEIPQCSICYEPVVDGGVVCSTCGKTVHTACLGEYRESVSQNVPCPTCRRPYS